MKLVDVEGFYVNEKKRKDEIGARSRALREPIAEER
jgi:hypothetical protein